jgi:hypothetical protein
MTIETGIDFTLLGTPGDTIFVLLPETDEAKDWADEFIGEHLTWGKHGIVVEHRYISDLLEGIADAGFTIGGR